MRERFDFREYKHNRRFKRYFNVNRRTAKFADAWTSTLVPDNIGVTEDLTTQINFKAAIIAANTTLTVG